MDQARASGLPENALFGALELSKDSWLLAIQFPDHQQPSLYPIKGGNATGLTEKLLARVIEMTTLGSWDRHHEVPIPRQGPLAPEGHDPGNG